MFYELITLCVPLTSLTFDLICTQYRTHGAAKVALIIFKPSRIHDINYAPKESSAITAKTSYVQRTAYENSLMFADVGRDSRTG